MLRGVGSPELGELVAQGGHRQGRRLDRVGGTRSGTGLHFRTPIQVVRDYRTQSARALQGIIRESRIKFAKKRCG